MTDWLNRCHFGDVRAVLRRMIADGVKVQCIVTSPPYWGLRSYLPADHPDKVHELGSEPTLRAFLHNMVEVFDLVRQVLADDGTAWLNMGDSYAGSRQGPQGEGSPLAADGHQGGGAKRRALTPSRRRDDHPVPRSDLRMPGLKPKDLMGQPWRLAFALQDAGWWLRQDIIWHKPNPMPESIRDRCTKAHEYIFLLAKSERYFYNFDAMQEPVNGNAHARRANGVGWGYADGEGAKPRTRKLAEAGSGTKLNGSFGDAVADLVSMRNMRSVWSITSEPYSGSHFATFPTELAARCIRGGTREGDTVLDIFFGSGTTGQVALDLGRSFIGIDLDERNEALQAERLATKSAARRQRGLLEGIEP